MQTSENIEAIGAALAKAQAELQNPPKNKINPHFKSAYVDLSDGLDVIRKTLSKHGISFIQATRAEDGFIFLHTRLLHLSGQWLESTYPVCGMGKHQEMGSALTYARRYSIFAMVGVAGEDDTDGNDAAPAVDAPKKVLNKVAGKTPTPGMTPEVSQGTLNVMMMALEVAESVEDLRKWAMDNKDTKNRLLPEHQATLVEAFKEKEAELKAA